MKQINNKLSTEQLNKMSIEEILAFNGFKKVDNELVKLEETKGNISSLSPCQQLVLSNTASSFSLAIISGPSAATVGSTTLTYVVRVTNNGGTADLTNVALYEDVIHSLISVHGTGMVPAGGHEDLQFSFNITPSTWPAGTYSICAKLGQTLID